MDFRLGVIPVNGRTSPGQAARQKRADNANNGVIKGGKGKPPQLRPGTEERFEASE